MYTNLQSGWGSRVQAMTVDTTGDIGIGDPTPDASLKLDVEGQVGATQYCDNAGNNCFTPSNASLWVLADTNEVTSSAGNDVDIE